MVADPVDEINLKLLNPASKKFDPTDEKCPVLGAGMPPSNLKIILLPNTVIIARLELTGGSNVLMSNVPVEVIDSDPIGFEVNELSLFCLDRLIAAMTCINSATLEGSDPAIFLRA